jgi:hypothetical protein
VSVNCCSLKINSHIRQLTAHFPVDVWFAMAAAITIHTWFVRIATRLTPVSSPPAARPAGLTPTCSSLRGQPSWPNLNRKQFANRPVFLWPGRGAVGPLLAAAAADPSRILGTRAPIWLCLYGDLSHTRRGIGGKVCPRSPRLAAHAQRHPATRQTQSKSPAARE